MAPASSIEIVVSLLLIVALLAAEWIDESQPLWDWLAPRPVYARWTAYYALLLLLVVMGSWNVRQFVYVQF